MTVESVPDSTPSSNSLVAEPQCLAHGPQHVCCWALQAVLGLQFGMEPDSAYLSISLLPSGSSRPFCLRSWVDRCFSFLDWIIRGWILCRGGYAGRRHAFLMVFLFFFFCIRTIRSSTGRSWGCPMGSEGAVFSHSPGEFYGIKQFLMGGAAMPMMGWG